MNHMFRLTVILLVGVAASLPAQDTNRWSFFQSLDWSGRLDYLQDTTQPPVDETFLRQALDLTDSEQIETGSDTDVSLKKSVAILLVRRLSALPSPASAPAIGRLATQYKDPLIRGESWLAVAKLGDRTAVPEMVRVLNGLNESGGRTRAEEIQAYYLVQSLGVLKAPEAFRTVVAAALAWYSPASQVKVLARKVFPLVVADPEKATLSLLADDDDLALREGLFQTVVDRGDPDASARASSAVLSTLVRLQAHDKENQDRAARLILSALGAAQKAPKPPTTLVPSVQVLLTRNDNLESTVQSIRLLGKIDDPSALNLLMTTLTGFNAQQKAGSLRSRDLVLVKELFLALAQTGKAAARGPLAEVRFSNYTPAIVTDAETAMAKLPRD